MADRDLTLKLSQMALCAYGSMQYAHALCCRLYSERQEGSGGVRLGKDHYLLDNRNRTQKWDE